MSEVSMNQDRPLGIGGAVIIVSLFAMLLLTIVVAAMGWTSAGDIQMSMGGWIALGLGSFFSLAVGIGLMSLVFYSSRKGYDEPVVMTVESDEEANDARKRRDSATFNTL